MKTIKLNGEYTEEQLLKLIEESKKPKHWSEEWLQVGDKGYNTMFIYSFISEDLVKASGDRIKSNENPLVHFKKKEHAWLMWEKTVLMYEMHNFAYLRNDGWVADWNNDQVKYGLLFYNNEVEVSSCCFYNSLAFGIPVKSKEISEEMFEVFGERLKEFYNKQF